jgi:hypothetical protein
VSFDFKGDHYEWVSSAPVVGNGGDWYAWVLADATYTPEVSSAAEIARAGDKPGETGEATPLKQALEGKTPTPTRPSFDQKGAGGSSRTNQPLRARTGASDRMENLLPKK